MSRRAIQWTVGVALLMTRCRVGAFVPTCRILQHPKTLLSLSSKDDNNDDDFMKALRSRMDQVEDKSTKLPIVVLDTMLPRQVLKMETDITTNTIFADLVKTLVEKETPFFGMIGTARLSSTGQDMPLQNGVEVEIMGQPQLVEDKLLRVELKGRRRMRILENELEETKQGWTEARVEFFDSQQEEEMEEKGDQPLSLARAMSLARQLVGQTKDGKNLIDTWIKLAKENEQTEGQTDQLLRDLGEMPSPDEPTELALWVGALINPLPGMGVAMEIRPNLLMASTAEERVGIALQGITDSIHHMDGSKRLW